MAKRKIKIDDLRRFKFVSDPQVSLDGEKIAFILSTVNHEKDSYDRHIWMADVSSGEISQFTNGPGSDTYPRWSPDGKRLLFLSRGREPEKKTQLYIIPRTGGEARLGAEAEEGVSGPVWSPDSRSVLFMSKVWTEEKPESDVKVIKRIKHKLNNAGFFQGRCPHVFTSKIGGRAKQITEGEFDVQGASWMPGGDGIAFIANMGEDADTSRVVDIYNVPVKGGEPLNLTGGRFSIRSLSYSPDGSRIAFVGSDRPEELAVDLDLWVMASDGSGMQNLTEGFDRSLLMGVGSDLKVATPNPGAVWSGDGEEIYFVTADTPHCNVYRIGSSCGGVEVVVGGRVVDGFSLSGDDSVIAFNALNALQPAELWVKTGEGERRLSRFNDRFLSQLTLSEPEHFTFRNKLGRIVDGWAMKPVDFEEGCRYPCVLEMHGGPRGVYGDGIFQEFQLLAAEGFGVIYTNPRGSAGYEEEYTQAVMRHYGEVDNEDFMDFTDEALRRHAWIDRERLGLTGGSYGGYTTNWIITQTDMFKAAVTFRSICNWVSKFGASDIGYMQPESISGEKTYWGKAIMEQLRHSPITYVDRVKTPCLVVHSEEDYRCPIDQGEQWFTALKLNGVPTEFVRFPGENHELSRSGKPRHREERFRHQIRWFNKYLKLE
jgi:dipeptidyl aminopeptidase/acylaminoacyl peptidase